MPKWMADDSTLINYDVYGNVPGRESVLLLHGFLGSSSTHWKEFIEPLSANYRVIQIDIRGHGRSENADTTLKPERIREDVEGLLDYLEIGWLHVAGYDFGGYLGLMLHLSQVERVRSLVMHATKFYWPDYTTKRMMKNLDPDRMSTKVPGYARQLLFEHGGGRWRTLVRQTADLVASISTAGLTENMVRGSKCPILVSVGDRDEMIPVAEASHLSRIIDNGALIVLPGVSHSFHSSSVQALLPPLLTFLASMGSSWLLRTQ